MKNFTKPELKDYSKNQLIDIILTIQEKDDFIKPPGKTSKNSSIPSSKDITKPESKNASFKKIGPKKGHKGKSRKRNPDPDLIIFQEIKECPRTGKKIESQSKSFQKHQIVELIPGKLFTIEIRRQITTGPDGKTVIALNPEGIKNHQRFGPYLKSRISTLRYKYHTEWDNIREMFYLFYGCNISKGAMNKMFNELKKELESEYNNLNNDINKSKVLGMDETGARINGKKAWGWIFRTDDTAFYKIADNRSHNVVEEVIGKEFDGTIVTDFYSAYSENFLKAKAWQKCLEHLRRDIVFAYEINNKENGFPDIVIKLLKSSIKLKNEIEFDTVEFNKAKQKIYDDFKEIISNDEICISKIEKRLFKRLKKYKDHIFTFLEFDDVPFDNNGSERDIRKWVIFRKIYGCFRSWQGAENLSVLLSIIETYKKRNQNWFDRIKDVYGYNKFQKILSP